MIIRTIIVEDETPSLERLKSLLQEFDEIEIVGQAQDGPAAVKLINDSKPDLAFLDIQLPVYSSFEVLVKIEHKPTVIFITAYDEYAIKAFEENAIDYLLKPTDSQRLARAIEKVRQLNRPADEKLFTILKSIVKPIKYLDRFSVKIGDEILFIPAEDVYWFQAEDKYIFLHTAAREFIYDSTLKDLEKALNPEQFIRIHKSTIVAIDKIHKMKRTFAGKFKVQLKDAKKSGFEIGRTFVNATRERLRF